MVFFKFSKGSSKTGIPWYRLNDYKYIKKHPNEVVCIIGRDQALFEKMEKNSIVLGLLLVSILTKTQIYLNPSY
jgi:3-methyladenine DNA glycosylase Tag